jgi:hypothetical protein
MGLPFFFTAVKIVSNAKRIHCWLRYGHDHTIRLPGFFVLGKMKTVHYQWPSGERIEREVNETADGMLCRHCHCHVIRAPVISL